MEKMSWYLGLVSSCLTLAMLIIGQVPSIDAVLASSQTMSKGSAPLVEAYIMHGASIPGVNTMYLCPGSESHSGPGHCHSVDPERRYVLAVVHKMGSSGKIQRRWYISDTLPPPPRARSANCTAAKQSASGHLYGAAEDDTIDVEGKQSRGGLNGKLRPWKRLQHVAAAAAAREGGKECRMESSNVGHEPTEESGMRLEPLSVSCSSSLPELSPELLSPHSPARADLPSSLSAAVGLYALSLEEQWGAGGGRGRSAALACTSPHRSSGAASTSSACATFLALQDAALHCVRVGLRAIDGVRNNDGHSNNVSDIRYMQRQRQGGSDFDAGAGNIEEGGEGEGEGDGEGGGGAPMSAAGAAADAKGGGLMQQPPNGVLATAVTLSAIRLTLDTIQLPLLSPSSSVFALSVLIPICQWASVVPGGWEHSGKACYSKIGPSLSSPLSLSGSKHVFGQQKEEEEDPTSIVHNDDADERKDVGVGVRKSGATHTIQQQQRGERGRGRRRWRAALLQWAVYSLALDVDPFSALRAASSASSAASAAEEETEEREGEYAGQYSLWPGLERISHTLARAQLPLSTAAGKCGFVESTSRAAANQRDCAEAPSAADSGSRGGGESDADGKEAAAAAYSTRRACALLQTLSRTSSSSSSSSAAPISDLLVMTCHAIDVADKRDGRGSGNGKGEGSSHIFAGDSHAVARHIYLASDSSSALTVSLFGIGAVPVIGVHVCHAVVARLLEGATEAAAAAAADAVDTADEVNAIQRDHAALSALCDYGKYGASSVEEARYAMPVLCSRLRLSDAARQASVEAFLHQAGLCSLNSTHTHAQGTIATGAAAPGVSRGGGAVVSAHLEEASRLHSLVRILASGHVPDFTAAREKRGVTTAAEKGSENVAAKPPSPSPLLTASAVGKAARDGNALSLLMTSILQLCSPQVLVLPDTGAEQEQEQGGERGSLSLTSSDAEVAVLRLIALDAMHVLVHDICAASPHAAISPASERCASVDPVSSIGVRGLFLLAYQGAEAVASPDGVGLGVGPAWEIPHLYREFVMRTQPHWPWRWKRNPLPASSSPQQSTQIYPSTEGVEVLITPPPATPANADTANTANTAATAATAATTATPAVMERQRATIRVAFISSFFSNHSVGRLLAEVIVGLVRLQQQQKEEEEESKSKSKSKSKSQSTSNNSGGEGRGEKAVLPSLLEILVVDTRPAAHSSGPRQEQEQGHGTSLNAGKAAENRDSISDMLKRAVGREGWHDSNSAIAFPRKDSDTRSSGSDSSSSGSSNSGVLRLGATPESVATYLRALQLDIAVFGDNFMDSITAHTLMMRVAPVEVLFWGHPFTSGYPTVDYFVTADSFEEDGNFEYAYTATAGDADGDGDAKIRMSARTNASAGARQRHYAEQLVRFTSLSALMHDLHRPPTPTPVARLHPSSDDHMQGRSEETMLPSQEARGGVRAVAAAPASALAVDSDSHDLTATLLDGRPVRGAEVHNLLSLPRTHVYSCLQSQMKLHPSFDKALAGILFADEHAVLLLLLNDRQPLWQRMWTARLRRLVLQEAFSRLAGEIRHCDSGSSSGSSSKSTDWRECNDAIKIADQACMLAHRVEQRVLFVRQASHKIYMQWLCRYSDVVLDPFPFGGGVTMTDAFSCRGYGYDRNAAAHVARIAADQTAPVDVRAAVTAAEEDQEEQLISSSSGSGSSGSGSGSRMGKSSSKGKTPLRRRLPVVLTLGGLQTVHRLAHGFNAHLSAAFNTERKEGDSGMGQQQQHCCHRINGFMNSLTAERANAAPADGSFSFDCTVDTAGQLRALSVQRASYNNESRTHYGQWQGQGQMQKHSRHRLISAYVQAAVYLADIDTHTHTQTPAFFSEVESAAPSVGESPEETVDNVNAVGVEASEAVMRRLLFGSASPTAAASTEKQQQQKGGGGDGKGEDVVKRVFAKPHECIQEWNAFLLRIAL